MIISMIRSENESEKDILALLKKGDEQATYRLYNRYVRYLTAICARYVSSDEDIKDIMQEAFLKIFSSVGSFDYRGEGSLKGWMARIVLNETLNTIKKNHRLTFVDFEPERMDQPEEEADTTGIAPETIHQMIRELPDGYRAVFNLYVIEEKSHKEIAELLGIKESSSASQLHRAKSILAARINQFRTLKSITV